MQSQVRIDRRQIGLLAASIAAALAVISCGGGADNPASNESPDSQANAAKLPPFNFKISTLSNRADLISDGDALVEVQVPKNVPMHQVKLTLNGADVGAAFVADDSARTFRGLLGGLVVGANQFVADANGQGKGRPWAKLTITNHPRGGPIISGPQLQPWVCATIDGAMVNVSVPGTNLSAAMPSRVSGLDANAVDAACNAPTKYSLYYQPKAKQGSACTYTLTGADPCFVVYNPASPPARADIADFTNDRGDTVKSIVRAERGTLNRGIYELIAFYDPALPGSALAPQKGWNGKLLWMFGANAAAHRLQAPTTLNTIFNHNALKLGYMVASASLNNNGTNANHVLAAESLMMVKERIIEQYGPIRYTIGNGCSGGSIQQQTIAGAYPGLLDGIQPICSYQDQLNIELEIKECGLLSDRYFKTANGIVLPDAKRSAIAGQINTGMCNVWVNSFLPAYNPSRAANCGPGFPQSLVYDPVLRPDGVRCTLLDHEPNRIGTFIDSDGIRKANKVFDNVGVQYGLKALQKGEITTEEFVQLNEGIGSYSPDLAWSGSIGGLPAARVASLPATLSGLYAAGVSSDGKLLSQVAIIDLRGNQNPAGDIHANWRSWGMRERLVKANGHHDNQVIWGSTPGLVPGAALALKAFVTMDGWLASVEADGSAGSRAAKIVANRPAGLSDLCFASTGATDAELALNLGLGTNACPVKFQASPRQTAGGPLAEDIYKCQLKALNFADSDYPGVSFDAGQRSRLQATFGTGVCDWSKPGVGQQGSPGWYTFASGAGVQLPPPPVSVSATQ